MAILGSPRPLSDDDPVEDFDCGRESINQWLRRHGKHNQRANTSRTTVFPVSGGAGLIGYVTLAAGHIEREHLTKSSQRNRPPHVPVILLGQLAVDRRFQGEGHAAQILAYTLRTCLVLSRDIGCFGVITHPVDDAIRAFYARYGFAELPGDPRRAMIVRIADLEANGFGRLGPE